MNLSYSPSQLAADRLSGTDAPDAPIYLSTAPAGPQDRHLAGAVVAVSILIFLCLVLFVRTELARIPAFVAAYESALAITDFMTATLLFGIFTRLRSKALYVLACGYLFNAFIIVAHALSFPGLFAPAGALGGGPQTTAWLYMFWHGVFPVTVICYALLKAGTDGVTPPSAFGWRGFLFTVALVAAGVVALTLLATAGGAALPDIMVGNSYTTAMIFVVSAVWTMTFAALAVLWFRRPHTVLDLWLMVVMCAWLLDVALSAMLNASRYDLGFYAGRSYGLLAASFVLAMLLLETNKLHDRLAVAQRQLAGRARDLERNVRQRTSELQRSSESLRKEISERGKAEQELSRTRSFLDVIVESLPAMLLVKDAATGRVVYLNRAGEELTGIDRTELIGKAVHEVMENTDADLIDLQDQQSIKSDKPFEMFENPLNTRKQGSRLVRTKKLVVPDEDGAPKYLLAFCDDITEQRQLEDQLRHSQKMEALGQLTGGLAHDFNNLLAIIIGNLDVLAEAMASDAAQTELVQGAIGAALSGSELTRRLLAFARRQPLQPEQVDLNRLIEGIGHLLRRTLGENIEIVLALDPAIPGIVVDRVQLETAIANLANNARDAMPDGGRLRIATRTAYLDSDYAESHVEVVPGNYAVIEVSDDGNGMPPEVLARIFEPFYTTKEPGKGTGLGLSMVFGFMKQSGGHINAYSEPGHGTTFRLYLRPAGEIAIEPSLDAPPLQPEQESRGTILVVEDNARLREIVVRQLGDLGFRVIEADTAQRALDVLAVHGSVDLLFTDVVLPGKMDGCALAREFMASSPDSKVLFTSGFPGARLADMECFGTDVRLLSKPYRKDELRRVIHEVLAERT